MKKIELIASFLASAVCFILAVLILTEQIEIDERIMFGMIFLCLSTLIMKGKDYDE